MITKLYTLDDTLISELVNTAILNPSIIQVENELLDGSHHIQIIGDVKRVWNITCYVDSKNKIVIDNSFLRCEPIKIYKNGLTHTGLIKDKSEWSVFIKGQLYEVNFKLHELAGDAN